MFDRIGGTQGGTFFCKIKCTLLNYIAFKHAFTRMLRGSFIFLSKS